MSNLSHSTEKFPAVLVPVVRCNETVNLGMGQSVMQSRNLALCRYK